MGIDWENILSDNVDLQDTYDSRVFESDRRATHDSYDDRPEDFNGNVWYKDVTGEESKDCSEYIASAYSVDKYIEFLKKEHNNLPKTALGKAFAFFMSEIGGKIMAANRNQAAAIGKGSIEEYEIELEEQLKKLPAETTYIKSGENKEAAQTILKTFTEYLKEYNYHYDTAFVTVYQFIDDCSLRNKDSEYAVEDLDYEMSALWDLLSETWYYDVAWDCFETLDEQTESLFGKFK